MTALTWRFGLDAAETADVLALLDAATSADHTAPVSEHVLLHLRRGGDPLAQHLLARSDSGDSGESATDGDYEDGAGGRLLGYAHLDCTDPVAGGAGELAVHPDARRHGVGAALVRAMLERIDEPSVAGGGPGARLRLWAHGEHPGAVRLADSLGFRRVRTLWQLRRSLLTPLGSPDSAAELPAGVRLRPFVVGQDEPEFLRVNNAAFEWHPEQGGWDIEQVKLREAEPWFDPAGFLLAVETNSDGAERLLGFHWTKVHGGSPDQPGSADHQHDPIGEVYVLGVDPKARGRRLGAALTVAGLRYLRERGLPDVMLYVEADNEAAVNVYRALGFTHWDTDVAYLRSPGLLDRAPADDPRREHHSSSSGG